MALTMLVSAMFVVAAVAVPTQARAQATCSFAFTAAYNATGVSYVMSQTVNPAVLAACDTRYPAVDSGIAPPTSGSTSQGGSFTAITNAADNTIIYNAPAGFSGVDTFTVYFCNDAGCSGAGRRVGTATVTVGTPTITVSPTSLPGAAVAGAYSQTLTGSGGRAPYGGFIVTSGALPAGLSLSSAGALTGTPTASGSFNFTIRTTDSTLGNGPFNGSRAYTMTVSPPTVVVGPTTVPAATVGAAYSQTMAASGGTAPYGAFTVTAGSLPAGLSLNAATGVLSGTPTAGGTYNFTVRATDSTTGTGPHTGSRAYSMTVNAPTISVNPTTLIAGTQGTAYSGMIAASGGTSSYAFAVTAGALPGGLSLAPNGALTGTPAVNGSFSFTVTATDSSTGSGPYAGARAYTLVINPSPAPAVTSISPTAGPAAGGSTVTITGTNFSGATAVNFGATAATGFTVNSATQITATAPAGTGTVNVRVTTVGGTSATGAANQYTYIALPTVTSASPISTSTVGGASITITGTNFTGATAVTFSGTAAASFTVNSATQITAVFAGQPGSLGGSVSPRVTTAGGTSAQSVSILTISPPRHNSFWTPSSTIAVGGSTTLGMNIFNLNDTTNLTGLSLSAAALPAGLTGSNPTTNCGGTVTYVSATRMLSLSGGSLAADSMCNVSLTVTGAAAGTYSYTSGTISASGPVTNLVGTTVTSFEPLVVVAVPTVTSASPASGPAAGGTTVTLTGTNFTGATAVTFDGLPASGVTVVNNTTITAVTPAHAAGAVAIAVTTPASTGSLAGGFTYIAAPVVTSVSPSAGPTTGGMAVTITGTNFSGATAITFGATAATGFTVNSDTQITATVPAGTGTVDVRVTTVGGTSATSAADQFTWVAAPTVTGLSPATGTTAGGTSVVLTGTNLSGTTAVTFGATPATGFTVNSTTQITATAPAGSAGTVDVRVTTAGGTSATSAADQFTYLIPATISVTGIPTTMTVGQTVTVTVTPSAAPSGSLTVSTALTGTAGMSRTPGSLVFTTATAQTFTLTASAPTGTKTVSYSLGGVAAAGYATPASTIVTVIAPPVASSFTYGSVVAYNPGATVPTSFNVSSFVTNNPTNYAVGSATTANGGTVSISSAGQVAYEPPVGFRGNDSFTYTATNGDGASAPATVTITVGNPTLAMSLTGSGVRGAALSGVRIDTTGGLGTYSCNPTPVTGALPAGTSLNADCTITGTPTASGTFTFTASVTDSSVGTGPFTGTSGTLSLTIAAPTLILSPSAGALPGATAGTAYSQTLTAAGATAPYGYALTAGALPPGLTLTGNLLSGAPTAVGTFNFTITATDSSSAGSGGPYTVTSAYSITVGAPTVSVTPTTVPNGAVGQPYAGTLNASGGTSPYSYAITAGALPNGLTLAPSGGAINGTPTSAGTFNFTITATDSTTGAGAPFTGSRAYALTIAPGAQTISFAPLSDASLSDSPLTLSASASSGLSVTFFSDTPVICTVSGANLTLVQTGTCTIRAEQPGNGTWTAAPSVSRSFDVTPALLTIDAYAATGLAVGGNYSQANTASGGVSPYGYRLAAGAFPPGTSLNAATGQVSGTPMVAGTFSYIVRVTDDQPLTADTGVTTVTIAKGSQTITFTSAAPTGAVVAGPEYTVTATASSGLGVIFSLDASSTGCALSGATVSFISPGTCVINAEQAGNANWNSALVQQSFTVIANPPIAADVSAVAVPYNSAGTDIDLSTSLTGGAHTSIAIVTAPAHGTTSIAGDVVTYTPAAGYYGADAFTWTATGPGGTSNVATVTLTVATPAAPVAADRSGVAVPWNSSGTAIDLSASITGVHASIAIVSAPSHGTTSIAGDVVTYTPAAGYYGADSFTWTATGPGGTSNVATVSLTVANPPAPTATGTSVPVGYNSAGVAIDLTANVSGVSSGVSVATAPAHGTTSISGYVITYTPAAGYYGADSFTYLANGPGGSSAPATISLQVAVPPPPTVNPGPPTTVPPTTGGSSTVNLQSQGQGVITGYRITTQPAHGTAVIESATPPAAPAQGEQGPLSAGPAFVLRYTPAAGFMGTDSVTLVAEGPGGDSGPATFIFQVPGQAPNLNRTVASNASVTVTPTTGLTGGPFNSVQITQQPGFGTAVVQGLNIVFTPGAANQGATYLNYTITTPGGVSAVGRIDYQVNLAPAAQLLTAATPAGRPVTVSLTANAVGAPFSAAAVTGITPSTAGTAVLTEGGVAGNRTYAVTFTPTGTFTGQVDIGFTLTNAFATETGVVRITVTPRPDPALDPDVRGLVTSQVDSARRFADAQISNFSRRLEELRDGDNESGSNLALNLNLGSMGQGGDPREGLRRQLGDQSTADDGLSLLERQTRDEEQTAFAQFRGRGPAQAAGSTRTTELGAAPASQNGSPDEGSRNGSVGVWAGGGIDWGRRDAEGQRDTRFTTSGVSAGADVKVNEDLIVGAGIGYGEDRTRIGDNDTTSDGESKIAALYAAWHAPNDLHLEAMLGYGSLDYASRRWSTAASAFAFGEREGDMTFGSIGLAHDVTVDDVRRSLYGRLQAQTTTLDAFTETGAGIYSLTYDEMSFDTLSSTVGVRLDWNIETRSMLFAPSVRVEWTHEFNDTAGQTVSYADWIASPRYGLTLDNWARDRVSVDLEGRWVFDGLELTAGYRGAASSQTLSHGLQLKLSTRF